MKDKKMKYVLSVLLITTALLLVVGTSYAYLASRRKALSDGQDLTQMRAATLSDLKLVYNDCIDADCENISGSISLGSSITKGFEITNSSGYDLTYSLFFQDILNTFENDELVYKIVSLDTNQELISTTPVPYKEHMAVDELIKSDIAILDGTTQRYEITITFLNTNYDQSENYDAEFFLSLGFIESNRQAVPVVGGYSRTIAPDFMRPTQTDEGIYESIESAGTTYYYRGGVENNYVHFANLYWRIVRINEDGSLRIVYDGTSIHDNLDASSDRLIDSNVAYDNIDKTLNDWYQENITNAGYDTYVSSKVFCYDTLSSSNTVNLSCSGNTNSTSSKVGLLTSSELIASGVGAYETGSANSYLYRGSSYWLSTNKSTGISYIGTGNIPFSLSSQSIQNTSGLVPVINISREYVQNIKGNGTKTSPYEI